jgi:FtsZ-binding cell division protein ZapB
MTSPEMTADLAAAFKLLDGTQNLSDAVEVVAALQARVTALEQERDSLALAQEQYLDIIKNLERMTDELARQRNILQSRVTVLELVIRRLPRKGESVYRSELDRALREAHAVLDPKGAAHGAV